ncbi:MAG: type I-U CRISPR-associated protein Cas5/Cas6 [Acidobacteriota bacterium]|nr:type I-U CRISPR-associated protein Cas5/Cas6 [Acidobacteriota bacterium]
MSSLTVAWEYLTGCVVATDPTARKRVEWPPHPARVFMAMAAAWFETAPVSSSTEAERGDYQAEGDALRWLEALEEPELWLSPAEAANERSAVTTYVPVNDKAGPAAAALQCAPAMTRSKQPRTFPSLYVGNTPCALHWADADGLGAHREALARVCAKVTRIGHSSSLVRMWLADSQEHTAVCGLERWQPGDMMARFHARRFSSGLLDSLPSQTQISRIETFAELFWRIKDARRAVEEARASSDSAAKRAASQRLKDARQSYEKNFGQPFRESASPPPRLRPKIGLWTGYRRADTGRAPAAVAHSLFDTELLVLTQTAGPQLPVASTLAVGKALRDLIMSRSGIQPVPAWISGHRADGSPDDHAAGHLAILPQPFVGREHADGHLLGMALAFPQGVGRNERGGVLGPLLVDEYGEPRDVTLTLGALGVWTLRKRNWSEPRVALQPETWTAHPGGTLAWASVTPVVLDRFPKADRSDPRQRMAWEQEVRAIVAEACTRIDLPRPIHIDIDTTSWQLGAPRAVTKRRRLRGASTSGARAGAALGDGFPDYPLKGTRAPRPQIHVFLQFAEPVCGPIVLGAGRYRGYGLLKPWEAPR